MDEKDEKKLDWMYKSANSLVDREEYLLGRTVDKTLENLNAEEKKTNKIVLPTPKNHVEHECIPPSIRDFNKIVQVDQVDLSAKLQEDPLVAIKKREEEARRQFLQNPVQLKKLQEALRAQEEKAKKKSKKKHKKYDSDSDLESKIAEKLRFLKGNSSSIPALKKEKNSKESSLDTILMHKFNALKDHLSEEDLKSILRGEDSEEESGKKKKHKDSSSEDSDSKPSNSKKRKKQKQRRSESKSSDDENTKKSNLKKTSRRRSISSEDERISDKYRNKQRDSKHKSKEWTKGKDNSKESYSRNKNKSNNYNRESSDYKYNSKRRARSRDRSKYRESLPQTESSLGKDEDSVLDRKISEALKKLRGETEYTSGKGSSHSKQLLPEKPDFMKRREDNMRDDSDSDHLPHRRGSDSEGEYSKPKSYGLVTSDGKKIALNQNKSSKKVDKPTKSIAKPQFVQRHERKQVKKLSEEEKDRLRQAMIKDAKVRDKEREENLRKHRESNSKEDVSRATYNKELVHMELMKSAKETSVEGRIKSNLNKIQRSSRHMDSNFSRR